MKRALLAAACLTIALPAFAQQVSPATPPKNDHLPPSDVYALDALKNSPRHGEMIDIKMPDGQILKSWIVYPMASGKVGVVIVIHEIFGLSDWARAAADQVAKEGYIAIAPDLLSGFGPNGGGSAEAGAQATSLIRQVTPALAVARIHAVIEYGKSLPASNGKTATIGFCWGGDKSFAEAVAEPDLAGAVVFYGVAPMKTVDGKQTPDPDAIAKIKAPVIGFYGGTDPRVVASVEPTVAAMKAAGKSYEPHIYDGATHGFVREQGNNPELTNYHAIEQAWPLVVQFLRAHLR